VEKPTPMSVSNVIKKEELMGADLSVEETMLFLSPFFTYKELRGIAKSGDILATKGFFGIRAFTGGSFSHVVMLVWIGEDNLYVSEYTARGGFVLTPASQWVDKYKGEIFYGIAPAIVRANQDKITEFVLGIRDHEKRYKRWYGFLSYPKIVLSQLFNKKVKVLTLVCSTYIQKGWEKIGYKLFTKTADPEDLLSHVILRKLDKR
jgi:hypothetical protein